MAVGKHRAGRTPRPVVETSDYIAFLQRAVAALSDRIADDPVALAHYGELRQGLEDAVNHGFFLANRGSAPYSQNEIAAVFGSSRQAVAYRIRLGEQVHADLVARRGGGALVRLVDIRGRRASMLRAAGVPDRTGSERERGLYAVGE